MSQNEFRDRLARISENRPAQPGESYSKPIQRVRRIRHGRLFGGSLIMVTGVQILKAANENYESLGSPGVALAVAGIGIAALIIGCVLIYKSMSGVNSGVKREPSQASSFSRLFWSLFGLLAGAIASFSAGLAVQIDRMPSISEYGETLISGSAIFGFAALVVSLFLGVFGLISRYRALVRVPLFFVIGALTVMVLINRWVLSPVDFVGVADKLK